MNVQPRRLDGNNIPEHFFHRVDIGIGVMDNLLNGDGLVPGQQISMDAPRGVGKTTLSLQLLQQIATNHPDKRVLYLSGEESFDQLNYRCKKLGVDLVECHDQLELSQIKEFQKQYHITVVDSFTCIEDDGVPLEVSANRQRTAIKDLTVHGRKCGEENFTGTTVYILQQTQSGKSRGPSTIEHMVDTVISLSKCDEESFGRPVNKIAVTKNRFGSGGEALMPIGGQGWDFDNVIDDTSTSKKSETEVRDTPQAKKPREIKALLKCIKECMDAGKKFRDSDINTVIDDSDLAAFGRHQRHLKELRSKSMVNRNGRGKEAWYELTAEQYERMNNA